MDNEHVLWVEKYRPTKIADCILPDNLKETFQAYVDRKEIPHLLLAGRAGIGKTTVAKALCEEVGCDYIVINGSGDGRKIDDIRYKIQNYASSMSLSGGRKVIIIDEADYMNRESVQPFLRNFIEEFSQNCSFIFTCNFKNKILDAIQSRCASVDFKIDANERVKLASSSMKRFEYILDTEGVTYEKKVVAALITKFFPDFRKILNEMQRYASNSNNTIDTGILSLVTNANTSELVKSLKTKNFAECRKWLANNQSADATVIMRDLYDSLYDFLEPNSIPAAVLILAKYQYQASFAADQEINMLACLVEFMMECSFK